MLQNNTCKYETILKLESRFTEYIRLCGTGHQEGVYDHQVVQGVGGGQPAQIFLNYVSVALLLLLLMTLNLN